jgi:chromosome partitioning protein
MPKLIGTKIFCCYGSKMHIVTILNQKGGAGKTTLSLHLAVAAEAAKLSTVLIDLDPQVSSANWNDRRQNGTPVVVSLQHARLQNGLQAAKDGGADLVVIDTAPHAEAAAVAAMRAADLVLVPTRPGILDLDAVGTTAELLKLVKTPAYVVLNVMPVGATQLLKDATAAVGVHGLIVAPVVLHQRADYAHSLIAGQTATEYAPKGKAAGEVNALLKWVRGILAAK